MPSPPDPPFHLLLLLADANINVVNPFLLKDLVIVILVIIGVTDKLMSWRRKPPVDVDLEKHTGSARLLDNRVSALEGQSRLLFKKVDGLSEDLRETSEKLGSATTAITHYERTLDATTKQLQSLIDHELRLTAKR